MKTIDKESLRIPYQVRGSLRKFYLIPPRAATETTKARPYYCVRFEVPRAVREKYAHLPAVVWHSTGTNLLGAARERAAKVIDDVFNGRWGEVQRNMIAQPTEPTLGQVLERYAPDPRKVSAGAVTRNKSTFRMYAREVLGRDNVENAALSTFLNAEAARRFVRQRMAPVAGKGDFVRENQVAKTINSTLAMVKSVVSPKVAHCYEDLKLPLAKIAEFRAVPDESVDDEALGFQPWPPGLAERIDAAAQVLRKADRNVYLVYLLMRALGLRNSEAENARWNWIEEHDEGADFVVRLRSHARVKNRGVRALRLSPELLKELRALQGEAAEDAPMIEADNMTERKLIAHEGINDWLRPMLTAAGMIRPGTKSKCAYQLRGYAGSRVLTDTGSIAEAAAFLGDTEQTTRKNYARFLKPVSALTPSHLKVVPFPTATAAA